MPLNTYWFLSIHPAANERFFAADIHYIQYMWDLLCRHHGMEGMLPFISWMAVGEYAIRVLFCNCGHHRASDCRRNAKSGDNATNYRDGYCRRAPIRSCGKYLKRRNSLRHDTLPTRVSILGRYCKGIPSRLLMASIINLKLFHVVCKIVTSQQKYFIWCVVSVQLSLCVGAVECSHLTQTTWNRRVKGHLFTCHVFIEPYPAMW